MPRDHGRLFTSIWSDDDFVALSARAQWLYALLLSQDDLSYAGHLDLRPRRWASRAAGVTVEDVADALRELDAARFLVVDEDTEEVLVRAYIRRNEVWKQPNVLTAALRQVATIRSRRLRHALREELLRLPDDPRVNPARTLAVTLPETPGGTLPSPPPGTLPVTPDGTPPETPTRAYGRPRNREQRTENGGTHESSQRGVTEADARASTVPDTRPPPLELSTPDEPRRSAPAAAAHENAMPADRCRNHLELADPPPCGRCKDARQAQEAWIADRDRKVATARQQAQADIAAEKAAARAAIDACAHCDDRGNLPSGVRCEHTDDAADRYSSGRAAFKAEKAKLDARLAARKASEAGGGQMANGAQLGAIAAAFAARDLTDRDSRLQLLGEIVRRRLTSSRELTSAEASAVLDRLAAVPVPTVRPGDPDYVDAEVVEPEDEGIPSNAEADGPADLAAQAGELNVVGWVGIPGEVVGLDRLPAADDDAADPQDYPDGSEDPPPGDDAAEDEYRRDQLTWQPDNDWVSAAAATQGYDGGPDDPPF